MEDYSLDAVAREVLGEGKAIKSDARDRLAEIIHNYRHDLPAFALYARTDARSPMASWKSSTWSDSPSRAASWPG